MNDPRKIKNQSLKNRKKTNVEMERETKEDEDQLGKDNPPANLGVNTNTVNSDNREQLEQLIARLEGRWEEKWKKRSE